MSLVSLYDEASLWMTPSGVKDGKLYSELPVPVYGPELVTNGNFATDSYWTKGSGATISGGKANIIGDGSTYVSITQNSVFTTGKKYRVSADVEINSGLGLKFQDGATNENIGFATSSGTYVFDFTAGSNTSLVVGRRTGGTAFNSSVDNVSVKEITNSGDFTFSRGSNLAATRVGADGLIEKGRENLLLQSNNFGTTWVTPDATITSGQADKDGSNNAWLLTATSAFNRVTQSVSQSGVKRFSVYAKANTNDYLLLGSVEGAHFYATFNLATGAVDSNNINAISPSIENVGNGWYRCSATWVGTTTEVRIASQATSGQGGWASTTSGSVLIQNAQLEVGLAATEYIETTTTTGKAGVLEDEPRLDYSGGATCPSLLLEPSRTNIIQSSEYFQDDYWAELGVHEFDTNTTETTSPTGDYSATKIVADTTLSNNHVVYGDVSQSSGTQYAVSIFAKAAEYDYLFIRGLGLGGAGGARFNISTGEVVAVNGYDSATIEDYGNGWYRCIAIGTSTTTGAPYYHMSPTSSFSQFAGNDSDGIYIFGAQCEQGSYATSYIPTHSGGSVTRGADTTATLDLSPIGLNGEDVTHFIDFKNNQFIVRDNGGTTFRFSSNTANHGSLRIYRSSSSVKHLTITLQDNNGNFSNPGGYEMTSLNPKVAIKRVWATGEIKAFVDGKNVLEGTNTLYNSWNKIDMGGTGSTAEVKQLISFPIALTDSECVELTINGIKEELITAYKKRATTLEEGASERLDTYLQSLEDFIII